MAWCSVKTFPRAQSCYILLLYYSFLFIQWWSVMYLDKFALDNLICLAQGREWLPPRLNWLQRWHAVWQRDLPGGERFFDNILAMFGKILLCFTDKGYKGNLNEIHDVIILEPLWNIVMGMLRRCCIVVFVQQVDNNSIFLAYLVARVMRCKADRESTQISPS